MRRLTACGSLLGTCAYRARFASLSSGGGRACPLPLLLLAAALLEAGAAPNRRRRLSSTLLPLLLLVDADGRDMVRFDTLRVSAVLVARVAGGRPQEEGRSRAGKGTGPEGRRGWRPVGGQLQYRRMDESEATRDAFEELPKSTGDATDGLLGSPRSRFVGIRPRELELTDLTAPSGFLWLCAAKIVGLHTPQPHSLLQQRRNTHTRSCTSLLLLASRSRLLYPALGTTSTASDAPAAALH